MNSNFIKGNRVQLQVLLQILMCIGLILVAYAGIFGNTIRGSIDAQRSASSTKTAIAMTAGALMGPFPTATVPTATASNIPTITSTIPTPTPTATRTLAPTATLLQSPTPRTRDSNPAAPPAAVSTNQPNPPTSAPTDPPPPTDEPPPATEPPAATDPPAELPPIIQTLIP